MPITVDSVKPFELIQYFYLLTAANIGFVIYNLADCLTVISQWNPIFYDLNQLGNTVEDDEIQQFEEKIRSSKLISNIVQKVKIIKTNAALSDTIGVDEIEKIEV